MSWLNCTPPSSPLRSEDEARAFVLLASTTATLSLVLNLAQFLVVLRTHLVLVHLCVCGQLASASLVLLVWREVGGVFPCLLPSSLHLLVLNTFGPLITLLVLQHHRLVRNRKSTLLLPLLIALAWCQATLVTLLPLSGRHASSFYCHMPPHIALLLCLLYLLHYPMVVVLLADHCLHPPNHARHALFHQTTPSHHLNHNGHRNPSLASTISQPDLHSPSQLPPGSSTNQSVMLSRNASCFQNTPSRQSCLVFPTIDPPIRHLDLNSTIGSSSNIHTHDQLDCHDSSLTLSSCAGGPSVPNEFRPRSVLLLLTLYAACTLPFVWFTAGAAAWEGRDPCHALVEGERAAMWTSWLTSVFAAIRPVLHFMMEEDRTIFLLRRKTFLRSI